MEQILGYVIFGTGWPVLIVGSIWIWQKVGGLTDPARTFLRVALATFYVLGYTATVYWLGQPWLVGDLSAFVVFLALFLVTIRTLNNWNRSAR